VVYGKAAAWDKLEQRLDEKKPRVFALRSWAIAAAAVLVLSIGISMIYKKDPLREDAWAIRAVQPDNPIVEPNNTIFLSDAGSKVEHDVPHRDGQPQHKAPDTVPQTIVMVTPTIADTPRVNGPTEITIKTNDPFKNMRVVHINDLNGDAPIRQGTTIWIANKPRRYFREDIPVVHINDLLQPNADKDWYQGQGRGLIERFAQRTTNFYGDYSSPFQQNSSSSPFRLIFRGKGN
jgi:hypothetical protein